MPATVVGEVHCYPNGGTWLHDWPNSVDRLPAKIVLGPVDGLQYRRDVDPPRHTRVLFNPKTSAHVELDEYGKIKECLRFYKSKQGKAKRNRNGSTVGYESKPDPKYEAMNTKMEASCNCLGAGQVTRSTSSV